MPKPLALPDVRQSAEHDCATAAWRCVYKWHLGRNAKVLDLSHPILGTDPATLEAVIRKSAGWHVRSGETRIEDLGYYAESLRPTICPVTLPDDDDSHYVTVAGIYYGKVHFQCSKRGPMKLPEATFLECWHGLGRHANYKTWSLTAWPV